MDHRAVGRHVGEEDQWDAAGEDACPSTDNDGAVAVDVVVESYARREEHGGLGPFARIDARRLEGGVVRVVLGYEVVAPVELQVGLIRFKVSQEVHHVCAQAIGQFEAVGHVPFVLHKEAGL